MTEYTSSEKTPNPNVGMQILPIYIVCDESAVVSDKALIFMNTFLLELHRAIASDPIIDERTRTSIVSFGEGVNSLLPLSRLTDIVQFPGLKLGGIGNLGTVFSEIKKVLNLDITDLKGQGFRVYRPIVLFISASQPSDGTWEIEHHSLVDSAFAFRPNIISLGLPGCTPHFVKEIATPLSDIEERFAFLIDDEIDVRQTSRDFARFITASLFNREIGGVLDGSGIKPIS